MRSKNRLLLSFILFLFAIPFTQAQEGWELGAWAGVSYYFGDLKTSFNFNKPGPAGGIDARYNFNSRICMRGSATYGMVSADDAESRNTFERTRNLSFQSDVFEGAVALEFNFLPYEHGSKDHFFTPYFYTGLSIFTFNPKAEYRGELVDLRSLGTEGQFLGEEYSSTSGALLYGIGMKVDLSYEWSLNFHLSGRSLFTDYLDDVSTTYPDYNDLENLRGDIAVALADRSVDGSDFPAIGETGRQRGNSRDNDSLAFFGISIMYYFGDLKCPKITR